MSLKTKSLVLSALMGAFSTASVNAQTCNANENTDIKAEDLSLEYMPESEFGTTRFMMKYRNIGTNATTRPITASMYELDENLNRVSLVLSRTSNSVVGVGLHFIQGGFTNAVQQGVAYEMEVVYPCDTNGTNNSEFQVAWNINNPPPPMIFKDGFESAPAKVAVPALRP